MQTADFMLEKAIRLARMTPRDMAPPTPAMKDEVEAVEAAPDLSPEEEETKEGWADRQKRIHALPKPFWFSIVDEIAPNEPRRPHIEQIQRVVAEHYGVTRDDILSARRTANVVIPRHVAMFLCREMTLKSLPEICRRTGNRDHTVGLYAHRKIKSLIERDAVVAAAVATIKAAVITAIGGEI